MVVEALESVKTINSNGDYKYPVKSVNIVKNHGKSTLDSKLIKGYALKTSKSSQ